MFARQAIPFIMIEYRCCSSIEKIDAGIVNSAQKSDFPKPYKADINLSEGKTSKRQYKFLDSNRSV